MSSEIYELMKRTDEAHVVEKAHRRPRFVEDCVREMVRGVIDGFPALDDRVFVSARQVNLETIHQHNVVAERFGTLGEIRHELATGDDAGRPHQPAGLAGRPLERAAVRLVPARPPVRTPAPTPPGAGAARRSSRAPDSTVIATVT